MSIESNLVDVGDLECQHGQQRDAGDRAEILPLHAVLRHHIADIDRRPDQRDQRKLDHADGARQYDRRQRRHDRLGGNDCGRFGEVMRCGPGRRSRQRMACRGRGLDHAAWVDLRHSPTSLPRPVCLPPLLRDRRKVVKKFQKNVSASA
jgi:hypothetical protein